MDESDSTAIAAPVIAAPSSDETATEPRPGEPPISPPALIDTRDVWKERIEAEQRLPLGLRRQLIGAIESGPAVSESEEPRLAISQVANIFAAALPSLVVTPQVAAHPAGEGFFRGAEFSSADAAHIASLQLERTGLAGSV